MRVLIAYLSAHGYDQPLAPKLLASPMSKDVTNIVQFLMRQVRQALGCLPSLWHLWPTAPPLLAAEASVRELSKVLYTASSAGTSEVSYCCTA